MGLEKSLASRLLRQEHEATGRRLLRPVARITVVGIALSVALILVSLFVVAGFKQEIRGKVNALVGTIRVSNPENSYDQYALPLRASTDLKEHLLALGQQLDPNAYLTTFTQGMALLKSDENYRGVLLFGRSEWGNEEGLLYADMSDYLVEGNLPRSGSQEVLLSLFLAEQLGYQVGDEPLVYFGNGEQVKVRKLTVVGLYETGYEQYDHHLVLASEPLMQSVMGWSKEEVGGVSVHSYNPSTTEPLYLSAYEYLAERTATTEERYALFTSEELNHSLFSWLNLLDANVLLILSLMVAVAVMTIITGVVVLILEKVPVIATLKSLGQRNASLKRTFRYMAGQILLYGLLWGNAVALLLAWVQGRWQLLELDPSQYFMKYVPVLVEWQSVVVVNVVVFLLVYLFVLLPTTLIAKVRPAESMRFE